MNLMAMFSDAICSNVRIDSVGVSAGASAGGLLDIFFSSLERVGDLEFVFLLNPRTRSLPIRVGVLVMLLLLEKDANPLDKAVVATLVLFITSKVV